VLKYKIDVKEITYVSMESKEITCVGKTATRYV